MTFALGALFMQAATVATHTDPVAWIIGGVVALIGLLWRLVSWFVKRLVESFEGFKAEMRDGISTLETSQQTTQSNLQAIRQELVGIDGRNGLKGQIGEQRRELRRVRQTLQRHSRVLTLLTDRADIEVPAAPDLDEEDEDDGQ